MSEKLRGEVLAYLARHHVITLATSDGHSAWAAAVFYANDGLDLYFLSSPGSRHGQHIAINPHVAGTIHEDYHDWREIKGIQLEGEVSVLSGDEEKHARAVYGAKFPVVGQIAKAPAAIVKALAKVSWYRLRPQRLFYIDNSKGFGKREELEIK